MLAVDCKLSPRARLAVEFQRAVNAAIPARSAGARGIHAPVTVHSTVWPEASASFDLSGGDTLALPAEGVAQPVDEGGRPILQGLSRHRC